MTLLEVARALGVETHYDCNPQQPEHPILVERPDLDIAHDVLAKLPSMNFSLNWIREARWNWRHEYDEERPVDHGQGTFPECVTALAERFLSERDAK